VSGPYGQDVEFILVVGGYFLAFLVLSYMVERYIKWKKDSA
jgi:hypothetical protein